MGGYADGHSVILCESYGVQAAEAVLRRKIRNRMKVKIFSGRTPVAANFFTPNFFRPSMTARSDGVVWSSVGTR